jgi:hypothetical protein
MPPIPKPELKVFISNRESTCDECRSELGRSAWIHLVEGKGALCLSCADLDHLEFLPSGNAALSRRARSLSGLSVIVLKWSRTRKRYERQGVLVEQEALERAEESCLADADARVARARRRAAKDAELDRQYIERFAEAVRLRYPGCPAGSETVIAEHACLKYSGRVGRTGAAKGLDPDAVDLAVRAHVRHAETNYDRLLGSGLERREARRRVGDAVRAVLERWSSPESRTPVSQHPGPGRNKSSAKSASANGEGIPETCRPGGDRSADSPGPKGGSRDRARSRKIVKGT